MGKINKYANIYDTEGNLIRHVGDDGKLKNYTIPELEDLLDKLVDDTDETGNLKHPQEVNNVYSILQNEYKKNPKYLFDKFNELQKKNESEGSTMAEKTSAEDVEKALQDTVDDGIIEPNNDEAHLGEAATEMKTLSEEKKEALYTDMKSFDKEELVERETDYEPDTYVQFEEVTDSDESSKEIKDAA